MGLAGRESEWRRFPEVPRAELVPIGAQGNFGLCPGHLLQSLVRKGLNQVARAELRIMPCAPVTAPNGSIMSGARVT